MTSNNSVANVQFTGYCISCHKPVRNSNVFCVPCGSANGSLSQYWWDDIEIDRLAHLRQNKDDLLAFQRVNTINHGEYKDDPTYCKNGDCERPLAGKVWILPTTYGYPRLWFCSKKCLDGFIAGYVPKKEIVAVEEDSYL